MHLFQRWPCLRLRPSYEESFQFLPRGLLCLPIETLKICIGQIFPFQNRYFQQLRLQQLQHRFRVLHLRFRHRYLHPLAYPIFCTSALLGQRHFCVRRIHISSFLRYMFWYSSFEIIQYITVISTATNCMYALSPNHMPFLNCAKSTDFLQHLADIICISLAFKRKIHRFTNQHIRTSIFVCEFKWKTTTRRSNLHCT